MSVETFRGRQLRRELLRLRESVGLSTEDVARELYWSKGKISRIETGKVRVTPSDVRLLCDVYGVTDPDRESLIQLARAARNKGWWSDYPDVFAGSYIALEAEAAALRTYASHTIPDVLRTPGYLRALGGGTQTERHTEALEVRKGLLANGVGARLSAVIDEAALRRPVGEGDVMPSQLRHLIEMAELPNVTLHVLPLMAGPNPARGLPFSLLDAAGPIDLTVAYVEHLSGELYLDEKSDVAAYEQTFDALVAASTDDLERLIGEL